MLLNRKKQNYGFTLVEVVVVIVILGIVTVAATISLSAASNHIDEQGTLEAISSALNAGRYTMMSTVENSNISGITIPSTRVELQQKDDGYHIINYINNVIDTDYRVCDTKHTLYFLTDTEKIEIIGTVTFIFDKSSGAFKSIKLTTNESGTTLATNTLAITTDKGDNKLVLALNTGRCVIQ